MHKNVDYDSKILERRRIAPILKIMEVNQTEIFSIIQMDSVRQTIIRCQKYERGKKFSTATDEESIIVVRVK